MILYKVYEQLKQRNFKTMLFIALVSWIIVTITYIIFGVCGYYIFGSFAEGDILNNFSQDNIWFIVARLAMTISIMGTYPLIFKSLMQTVEYTFFNPNNVNGYTFSNTKCLRSGIIISINIILIVVGLVVSNVGIVSSIGMSLHLHSISPIIYFKYRGSSNHFRFIMSISNINDVGYNNNPKSIIQDKIKFT